MLDAGCGTGNVTRAAATSACPRGRVIAVDAAPSMVEQARALLPAEVEVRQADLLELTLGEPVDAVLSTATFHWIPDHERLFARLHAALKPGGRLVAQCGGHGNVAEIKQAGLDVARRARRFAAHFERLGHRLEPSPRRRTPSGGCARRASRAVWCWLTRVDVDPGDPAATCARSASALSSRACRRSCTSRS